MNNKMIKWIGILVSLLLIGCLWLSSCADPIRDTEEPKDSATEIEVPPTETDPPEIESPETETADADTSGGQSTETNKPSGTETSKPADTTKPAETSKPETTNPAETNRPGNDTDLWVDETDPPETKPVDTEQSTEPADTEKETEPPVTETDPVETDPVETDPVETDPVETDPVETDPVETDPVETDPVETDPVETDPVETDPPADDDEMTYEKFITLSGEEQLAFINTFSGPDAFFAWYNTAKQEYEDAQDRVEIGDDGNIDLGGN